MELVSLITGVLATSFAVCLFSNQKDAQERLVDDDQMGIPRRLVTLSCQSCRKLKHHREIQENLFVCTKCRRHIDLR